MPRKRYSTEQIVTKLRQAEVELGRGLRTPQVCKKLGISEQTYYRWRKEYGGLGLETLIAEHRSDSRQGLNTQFTLADLLRQSVYSPLAGYEDLNDAVRVSADPTFRLIGSPKLWDRGAALTSTLHWFETDLLSQISLFAASDLSSAVATAAAIAVFASESNGSRSLDPGLSAPGNEFLNFL